MWFGIITLFPEMFQPLQSGVLGRALEKQKITIEYFNPREYTQDKYRTVDDYPYGGGPGMIMLAEPLLKAIDAAKAIRPEARVIYLSPQGHPFQQKAAEAFAQEEALIFIAGRYEGIDERVIELAVDEEWSIGDYILTGGELPIMVIIDAIARLRPGVVGDEACVREDSHASGLLKYPQFSRPNRVSGNSVPDVLLSGNHKAINTWRRQQSLGRTWIKRPDILDRQTLSQSDQSLLNDFIKEYRTKSK